MSYLLKAILGAAAVSLSFGAVQLASGHDLTSGLRAFSGAPKHDVTRAAKADRAGPARPSAAPERTISLRLDSLSDTSILVRIPLAQDARSTTPPSLLLKSGEGKSMVACEPVVSVLTNVAKQLQPGRCVT